MTYLKEELFTEDDIIDPNWIIRYLYSHLNHGTISVNNVKKVTDKMLKHFNGVSVKYKYSKDAEGCFIVAGVYDTEIKKSIQVEIFANSLDKNFIIEPKYYRQFIFDLADTLCHESIHRYQHKVREFDDYFSGFSTENSKLYYSDPDELFAYSVNIAHSLYRLHGKETIEMLSSYGFLTNSDVYFNDYVNLFENQKILKKLLKMIYLNILAIQNGDVCHRERLTNV
jgi:hypothetical protein